MTRISRIVGTPAHLNMTIRNWNTTTKIFQMMKGIPSTARAG